MHLLSFMLDDPKKRVDAQPLETAADKRGKTHEKSEPAGKKRALELQVELEKSDGPRRAEIANEIQKEGGQAAS